VKKQEIKGGNCRKEGSGKGVTSKREKKQAIGKSYVRTYDSFKVKEGKKPLGTPELDAEVTVQLGNLWEGEAELACLRELCVTAQ